MTHSFYYATPELHIDGAVLQLSAWAGGLAGESDLLATLLTWCELEEHKADLVFNHYAERHARRQPDEWRRYARGRRNVLRKMICRLDNWERVIQKVDEILLAKHPCPIIANWLPTLATQRKECARVAPQNASHH